MHLSSLLPQPPSGLLLLGVCLRIALHRLALSYHLVIKPRQGHPISRAHPFPSLYNNYKHSYSWNIPDRASSRFKDIDLGDSASSKGKRIEEWSTLQDYKRFLEYSSLKTSSQADRILKIRRGAGLVAPATQHKSFTGPRFKPLGLAKNQNLKHAGLTRAYTPAPSASLDLLAFLELSSYLCILLDVTHHSSIE